MASNEEHVWDIRRCVHQCQRPLTTLAELGQALQQEWNTLPHMAIGRIIHRMPDKSLTTEKKHLSNITSNPNCPSKIFGGHKTYCNTELPVVMFA